MAHQMIDERCNSLLNSLEKIVENYLFFAYFSDHIPTFIDDNLGRIYVVELLLDAKADVSQDNFKGWTMLDLESWVIALL